MRYFHTITKNVTNIFKIGFRQYDKIDAFDTSRRSFYFSFQTLILLIPFIVVYICIDYYDARTNNNLIVIIFKTFLTGYMIWFAPLIIFFILASKKTLKKKLLLFTIVNNWLQAALILCLVAYTIIITIIMIIFQAILSNFFAIDITIFIDSILMISFFIVLLFLLCISYRVLEAILQETSISANCFFFLSFLISIITGQMAVLLLG